MRIDFNQFTSPSCQDLNQPMPLPGEIWEVRRSTKSPLKFSSEEEKRLYSDTARRFLEGTSLPRYAMIVKEPEPPEMGDEDWQVVSVMLFSEQTRFLSNVDILLPAKVSGMEQDLLALTWLVEPMLTCNLSHPTGRRLSRNLYDVLLAVGDYYHGLVDRLPLRQEIQSLELQVGTSCAEQLPAIAEFHRQEEAWTDILKVPLEAYRTYQRAMNVTGTILDAALEVEQEYAVLPKGRVSLSQWL